LAKQKPPLKDFVKNTKRNYKFIYIDPNKFGKRQKEKFIMARPKSLLAFVHLHKTAGTTLNHILRRNFFMRYLDVRPLTKCSNGVFRAYDLKKTLRINPAIRCISGHSVKAFSDLESMVPDIKYITLLRDPIKRCVSDYLFGLYFKKIEEKDRPFKVYLAEQRTRDYQTKAIAGNTDLAAAKEILTRRFWIVGITEDFDEFLIQLRKKLELVKFDPLYTRQNVASNKKIRRKETAEQLLKKHRDEIVEMNRLDMKLYEYVQKEILPKQRAKYGPELQKAVADFKLLLQRRKPRMMRSYLDYAVRKFYYDPIIGLIRKMNGLPYKGTF
jgi:hypothetical protein